MGPKKRTKDLDWSFAVRTSPLPPNAPGRLVLFSSCLAAVCMSFYRHLAASRNPTICALKRPTQQAQFCLATDGSTGGLGGRDVRLLPNRHVSLSDCSPKRIMVPTVSRSRRRRLWARGAFRFGSTTTPPEILMKGCPRTPGGCDDAICPAVPPVSTACLRPERASASFVAALGAS